ncbi:hypothetical protein K438DRAFT_1985681 [Mycena galopus ATCC 62051]|nr:hypothetical protein K438DRAFT_1985681 [Mycena galopus ATCC 62051]
MAYLLNSKSLVPARNIFFERQKKYQWISTGINSYQIPKNPGFAVYWPTLLAHPTYVARLTWSALQTRFCRSSLSPTPAHASSHRRPLPPTAATRHPARHLASQTARSTARIWGCSAAQAFESPLATLGPRSPAALDAPSRETACDLYVPFPSAPLATLRTSLPAPRDSTLPRVFVAPLANRWPATSTPLSTPTCGARSAGLGRTRDPPSLASPRPPPSPPFLSALLLLRSPRVRLRALRAALAPVPHKERDRHLHLTSDGALVVPISLVNVGIQ